MTALRQTQPIRPIAPRRHLRPIANKVVRPAAIKSHGLTRRPESWFSVSSKREVGKILAGLVAFALLGLVVSSLCDAAVYKVASIKNETEALSYRSQIVSQQVDSLRSPQNLSNSAKALGMVVNSNPVFLSVKDAKVLGSANPASNSAASALSKNLIANAAMTLRTNVTALRGVKTYSIDAPKLNSGKSPSVSPSNSADSKVALVPAGIPASPTN